MDSNEHLVEAEKFLEKSKTQAQNIQEARIFVEMAQTHAIIAQTKLLSEVNADAERS